MVLIQSCFPLEGKLAPKVYRRGTHGRRRLQLFSTVFRQLQQTLFSKKTIYGPTNVKPRDGCRFMGRHVWVVVALGNSVDGAFF